MKYKFNALVLSDSMATEVSGRAVSSTRLGAENSIRKGLAKQFNTDSQSIEIEVTEL